VQAFWREAGLSGEVVTSGGKSIVSSCQTGPLCVAFDATSSSGQPALVSFIGGQQQLEYASLSVRVYYLSLSKTIYCSIVTYHKSFLLSSSRGAALFRVVELFCQFPPPLGPCLFPVKYHDYALDSVVWSGWIIFCVFKFIFAVSL